MKLKAKIILSIILIGILVLFGAASYLFVFGGIKKVFPAKEIKETHTIKIGERDVQKLITATQFVDFITVLISGDRKNEYLEYQTYKVEAGIDLNKDKNSICIVNKPVQYDRTVLKSTISADRYDSYVKPVREAYAIKACDIAVKYKLLEKAKENVSDIDKKIFKIPNELKIPENARTDVKYLPCYFETYGDILDEDVKNGLNGNDFVFYQQEEFSRDAVKIGIKGAGKDTYIRVGYTGRRFEDDTFDSFRKRLQTENENITVFTYFDSLDDGNTKQVLSYADDSYRWAFILHGGKLYYIDLIASDADTRKKFGYLVLYLAMSMNFDDDKSDISSEYIKYIEEYESSLTLLRNKDYPAFSVGVDNMLRQKENKAAETSDEKMLYNAANYFKHSEKESLPVNDGFDVLMNNCNFLYDSYKNEGNYTDSEKRDLLLKEIADSKIKEKQEVRENILTYFLQKSSAFGLTEQEKSDYLKELTQSALAVDRTILESFNTDKERNDFYTKLFEQAAKKNGVKTIIPEVHPDMTFCFMGDIKKYGGVSGELEKKLKERNDGIPLGNVFVLVFSESEFPIFSNSIEIKNIIFQYYYNMEKSIDNLTRTVHALVFDNCSVRLFTCLDDDSLFEYVLKEASNIKKFFKQHNTIKDKYVSDFVRFDDWRKMNIYKDGVAFLGFDFSNTSNYDEMEQEIFKKTEIAKEIRTVGEVLLQLQHAYENDDFHFELALDFVEREMRNHIYEALWRPSLKISDAEVDKMERYNYIWTD